jgi:hypothetical protein
MHREEEEIGTEKKGEKMQSSIKFIKLKGTEMMKILIKCSKSSINGS